MNGVRNDDLLGWLKPEAVSEAETRAAETMAAGEFEIYSEKLNMILDEAREIFVRTGVSGMLHSGDLIVGVYTPAGDMVNASCGTYLHAVTAQLPVKYLVHNFLARGNIGVNDGDVFYCNEARIGGIHNPDQMAIMPIFHQDTLIAWAVAAVHQPETGATEPGGMPVTARSPLRRGDALDTHKARGGIPTPRGPARDDGKYGVAGSAHADDRHAGTYHCL